MVGTDAVNLELNPARSGEGDQQVSAGDKPGQLRPASTKPQMDYRYVVMPMHL